MQRSLIIYCVRCGASVGAATSCPVGEYGYHKFEGSDNPVYCVRCGKTPGTPETCPVGEYGYHKFEKAQTS